MSNIVSHEQLPFPVHLDATNLAAFKACERKWYYNYHRSLHVNTGKSVHLIAGGAFARGLAIARLSHFAEGKSPEVSIACAQRAAIVHWGDFEEPEGSPKNLGNILLAIEEYFSHYGFKTDPLKPHTLASGKPAVECSFALPLPINHPTTGQPILYTGRYDMLGELHSSLFVTDEKTTSKLGPSWSHQWDLRSQFIGYSWAARKHKFPVAGVIVRGISILKRSFGHAEVIVYCPSHIIEAWLDMTVHTIERMISCWKSGQFLRDFDAACASYSGCPYKILCDKKEPETWVESNFHIDVWNPLDDEGEKK